MLKILITGDFCPHKRIEQLVLKNNFEEIYNDFLPSLENTDINITNLECPLINSKSPIQKIGPNLIGREESIKAINFGKFNLVTLSNNHILDQGEKGLLSTINICQKNSIDYVGAGKNLEEASRILYKIIKDKKIAFLNFSENEFSSAGIDTAGSNPLNPVNNYYSINIARKEADYVIVIVHGGHEGYSLPSPRMVETYRFFIDTGADIVVGHHPHCFSGYEKYKDGFIFYSLGNFIFDKEIYRNTDWNYGYALKLLIDENKEDFDIIPYKQCDSEPGLSLLNDFEKQEFDKKIKRLNRIIEDSELLFKEWKNFLAKRRFYYLINFECSFGRILAPLQYRKLLPCFISEKKKIRLLNLIRCESHRDLSIECLKPISD